MKLWETKLDKNGDEVLDPQPVEVPLNMKRPESLEEKMRRIIRSTLSQRAHEQGFETFEEADDFDVGDDYDPTSPWEDNFDPKPKYEPSGNDSAAVPAQQVSHKAEPVGKGKATVLKKSKKAPIPAPEVNSIVEDAETED